MNRWGIDIGRVIINGTTGPGDTSFFAGDTAAMLRTPAVPEAFETIARLVPRFTDTWLVSKCGPRIQARSLAWLHHHDFFSRTGIPTDHVRFCLRRPEKALHCSDLGLTHFVDDKPDVIAAITPVVPHRYLFRDWPTTEAAIAHSLTHP
ncbi:hypothetical protein OG474_07965 [Kribbella sp. NBC_01505]|uniref:hypothetical protein n=1 Tax=Kribbella sp. NBC_01505 TaxID=2903580 RepID=UPI003864F630